MVVAGIAAITVAGIAGTIAGVDRRSAEDVIGIKSTLQFVRPYLAGFRHGGTSAMMKWIGPAVLAAMVIVGGPIRIESAAATSSPSAERASSVSSASTTSTDISARRHVRRYHHNYHSGYRNYRYGYRPYYPRYYARPYDYEPYPYYAPAPLPFGFSFGFGPFW